jgi:hypothetical protein
VTLCPPSLRNLPYPALHAATASLAGFLCKPVLPEPHLQQSPGVLTYPHQQPVALYHTEPRVLTASSEQVRGFDTQVLYPVLVSPSFPTGMQLPHIHCCLLIRTSAMMGCPAVTPPQAA